MVEHTCQHCGEKFVDYSKDRKYCSKECYNEDRSKEHVTEQCGVCGVDVEQYKVYAEKGHRTFCGESCEKEWRSQYYSGEDNPAYSQQQVECDNCGQGCMKIPYNIEHHDQHFCSKDCRDSWMADYLSSPKNPRWRTGEVQRDYGDDWLEIRREVMKRDEFECQRCGMSWQEHHEKYGSSLHVHHKKPVREFDNISEANTMDNLVTLCTSCHTVVEHE